MIDPDDEIARIERGLVLYMRILFVIGVLAFIAAGFLWVFGYR